MNKLESLKSFRKRIHELNHVYAELTDEETGGRIAHYWLQVLWEVDEEMRRLIKEDSVQSSPKPRSWEDEKEDYKNKVGRFADSARDGD
jgi:hypothetical protein